LIGAPAGVRVDAQRESISMKRRTKIFLAAGVVSALALFVGLRMSVNRIVWSRIASATHETYGVELTLDDLSLSLLDGRATAYGLRITDAGAPVIEVEELELAASLRDLLGGSYDFAKLVLVRPVVHLTVEDGATTNLARILARAETSDEPASLVNFQDARIVDGRCVLDDALTDKDHPLKLVFEDIDVAVSELQVSGEPRSTEIGDFRLDAQLSQASGPARISIVGWAPPLGDRLTMALHAAVTGLDLGELGPYVGRGARSTLGGDVLHLGASMRVDEGVILDGAVAAKVVASGADYALRFGGTTSGIVFDEDSKLAALFQVPFARLGHLGDVALTSTWGAASDVGAGIVDAGKSLVDGAEQTFDSLVQLDPLGALEAAGGGVFDGAKELGGGILSGVERLFGGRESKADGAKREAKEQREFSRVHEGCRREMLAAALVSAKNSSLDRRRRIEAELEAAGAKGADIPRAAAG
jgi:hypothetical protein